VEHLHLISTCHLTGRKEEDTLNVLHNEDCITYVHSHFPCKECFNFVTEGCGSKSTNAQFAHICKSFRYPSDIRMNGYQLSRIKILPYETEVHYYEMTILTNLMSNIKNIHE
jgi:Na+-transporting NADH:ubiquinone oxidoreductase subunit NqrA